MKHKTTESTNRSFVKRELAGDYPEMNQPSTEMPIVSGLKSTRLDDATIMSLAEQHVRLRSICVIIRTMCECAEDGEIDKLSDLFAERQSIMDSIVAQQPQLKQRIQAAGCSDQVNSLFASIMKAVETGDDVLLRILRLKKDFIVEKSREALMHRLVAHYKG